MKFKKRSRRAESVKISLCEGKREVGRVFLYLIRNDLHKDPYGLVEDLFVKEEYRSQGLGTELVKQAIKLARQKRCYKLLATSRMENAGLHKWYKKLGFEKHGIEFRMDLK